MGNAGFRGQMNLLNSYRVTRLHMQLRILLLLVDLSQQRNKDDFLNYFSKAKTFAETLLNTDLPKDQLTLRDSSGTIIPSVQQKEVEKQVVSKEQKEKEKEMGQVLNYLFFRQS